MSHATGEVTAGRWRLASEELAQLLAADHAPASIPPFTPRQPPSPRELEGAPALPSVAAGLVAIAAALASSQAHSASAAEQVASATESLIAPFAPTLPLLFASGLSRTDFFAWFVAQLALNPCRAAQTYNAAAARHPSARIAALAGPGAIPGATSGRCELPLWRLDPSTGVRSRVWSDQLAAIPTTQLAPRALALTAILRLAACDLFIHGTGGAGLDGASGYDAITAEWLSAWLGPSGAPGPLAPTATVTATLTLPLAAEPPPTPEAAAHAAWRAHHARHDPELLASPSLATLKRTTLAAIGATRDRRERAEHFQRLHAALRTARAARAADLDALAQAAADLRRRADAGALLADRTWSFPFHAQAALADLSARIATLVG